MAYSTGDVVTGKVTNFESYGAFVNIGGATGLLHNSQMSWEEVNDPEEVLSIGEEIEVIILEITHDAGGRKYSLGRKQLIDNPYEQYQVGDIVEGRIDGIVDYGAFVKLDEGGTGLLHKSEMSWSNAVEAPHHKYEETDRVTTRVMRVEPEKEKISLSTRQVDYEKLEIEDLPAVDTTHSGHVFSIGEAEKHLIVGLGSGRDGILPYNALSSKLLNPTPDQLDIKRGDSIQVRVTGYEENGLGLRFALVEEADLWTNYARTYPEGSVHNAEIISVGERNVLTRLLPKGPETRVNWKQLIKGRKRNSEGKLLPQNLHEHYKKGQEIEVRVQRFSLKKQQVHVSERAVQAETPPEEWLVNAKRFHHGSYHLGEIASIDPENGAIVVFPSGAKGLAARTLLHGSIDSDYSKGDPLPVRVHHFSLSNREIVLEEVSPDDLPEETDSTGTSFVKGSDSKVESPRKEPSQPESSRRNRSVEKHDAASPAPTESHKSSSDSKERVQETPQLTGNAFDVEQLKSELKEEVRNELREKIIDDLSEDLRGQILHELRDSLAEELLETLPGRLRGPVVEVLSQRAQQIVKDQVNAWSARLNEEIEAKEKSLSDWIKKEHERLKKRDKERIESVRLLLSESKEKQQWEPERPETAGTLDGEEKDVVRHVKKYIKDRGFYYEPGVIANFYTCLKSDYLVILSGISGVGKSKLPEHFVRALGGVFRMVPVRPNWNDDRDLLGYYNPRTKAYQPTDFLETIIEAGQNRERLYVICLDEMNLASPEYYFALFLSRLESETRDFSPDPALTENVIGRYESEILVRITELHAKMQTAESTLKDAYSHKIQLLSAHLKRLERYQHVTVPPNVKFVGTVNIDHTTEGFSNKVLDRANVMQFSRAELEKTAEMTRSGEPTEPLLLPYKRFESFAKKRASESETKEYVERLYEINNKLSPAGLPFGHRVLNAIERYMSLAIEGGYFEAVEDFTLNDAFDRQIIQRILPKIQGMGSEKLSAALSELEKYLARKKLSASREKVEAMIDQLDKHGYVNYWEVS